MSSPITLAQSPTIHPLAHILGSCAFTSVVAPFFYSLSKLHHETASHPSLGVNKSPERGRAVRRNTGTPQNGRIKYNNLHTHQGSPLVSISRSSSCSLHRHPPVAQGPSHLPSNRTSVYPVPALHLLPPSSPF